MATDHATRFWNETEEYHELAQMFEENIEYRHPNHLSGRSKKGVSWCNCSWCATRVKYPTYSGPGVAHL